MDYQGNSNKDKAKPEAKAKVEKPEPDAAMKAITTEAKTRKKPLGERMKGLFFGGEFKSAAQYIGAEVLLPALRNLLVDASSKGIERMVYGDQNRGRSGPSSQSYGPRMTYNTPVQRNRTNLPDQMTKPRARSDNTELIMGTRADAEIVLDKMNIIIEQYDIASVADLHAIAGLPFSHVDNKWGWVTLRYAQIRQTRDGWILDLPPVEAI